MAKTDPCRPIRDDIEATEEEIQQLQEILSEVPPRLKPGILELIKRDRLLLQSLLRALRACEASHRGSGAADPKRTHHCPTLNGAVTTVVSHAITIDPRGATLSS